ncbi:MAG: dual specificity protein phosphatase family protein [Caldilineaceae bacterium]|nr:dual specificity protein phosphatase family protein [Caldilineaceae bacterium]
MMRAWYRRLRAGARITFRILADLPRVFHILVREVQRKGLWVASQYTADHLVRLSRGAPPLRYSRITPHLHVGGQYTAAGWRQLQARGVTAVVNMRDEFDDAEAGIAPEQYLFLPTVDDTPPTIAQLCQGVRFIRQQIEAGGEVYVHCMLGVGRSVTMVAAYLVATGMSPALAWRTIRRRRPFIQPTLGQEARLAEFAAQRMDFAVDPEEVELDDTDAVSVNVASKPVAESKIIARNSETVGGNR